MLQTDGRLECDDEGLPTYVTPEVVRMLAAARPRKGGGGDGGIEALARAVAQLSAGRSDRIAAAANRTNATAAPPRAVLPLSVLFDSGGAAVAFVRLAAARRRRWAPSRAP